jgi:Zn-dependent peptidase ImmA (M78 family)
MKTQEFNISKAILEWIADSQGFSVEELAYNIAPKKVDKVVQGIVNKTQARELAKLGNIPFGFLFLSEPPVNDKPSLPDFRNTLESVPISDDFYDVYTDIQEKLNWFDEYLTRNGIKDKLSFVGRFNISTPIDEVAVDIRSSLDFEDIKLDTTGKQDYLKEVIDRLENLGILIFKNGIVNVNTRRSLDVNEFRGFAIANEYTPAIFINGNDSISAQLFTLLHEVAHIWIGKGGISNWAYPFENEVETYCNKVAAEVLMPTFYFEKIWDSTLSENDNISKLSSLFKTSELSITIKANQLNLVTDESVILIREELNKHLRKLKSNNQSSGGNYYNTLPWRNSRLLTKTIVSDALNQNTLLTEASRLLHAQPSAIMNQLAERI